MSETRKQEGFPKSERIVSQKLIDELFTSGQSHSLAAFPLRAVYLLREEPCPATAQVLISVPKRHFKHAVDRNRVKRQLREAWRKNKQLLTDHLLEDKSVALAFIWLSDQHLPTVEIEQRVVNLLRRMAEKLQNHHS